MGEFLCGELISLGDIEVGKEDVNHAIASLFVVVPEKQVIGHILSFLVVLSLDILQESPK